MEDARGVSGGEPCAHVTGDRDHAAHRHRTPAREVRTEHLAGDELHRQEAIAAVLPDVERARDVPVRHASGELHFATKALEHPGRRSELLLQDLERHDLVELAIAGAVDRPHTAGAEHSKDLVATAHDGRPVQPGGRSAWAWVLRDAGVVPERSEDGLRAGVGVAAAHARALTHRDHASSGLHG